MSGQRARSNLVNVDGADATDNSTNGVRSTVSQEAVQEFQIITNSYAAEYGRAAGGVVNIITRSGSNDFHGDVYGYLRNRNFQAVNPFSTDVPTRPTRACRPARFRRADQERQDLLLLFLRSHAAARDGILQHCAGDELGVLQASDFRATGSSTLRPLPAGIYMPTTALAGCIPGSHSRKPDPAPLQSRLSWLVGASSGIALTGSHTGVVRRSRLRWPSGLDQQQFPGFLQLA